MACFIQSILKERVLQNRHKTSLKMLGWTQAPGIKDDPCASKPDVQSLTQEVEKVRQSDVFKVNT